jgi:hypothetical protein
MNTEYSGVPAISQLCLRPKDISSGMYDDSTLSESSTDSLLNIDVRPEEPPELCAKLLTPFTGLY